MEPEILGPSKTPGRTKVRLSDGTVGSIPDADVPRFEAQYKPKRASPSPSPSPSQRRDGGSTPPAESGGTGWLEKLEAHTLAGESSASLGFADEAAGAKNLALKGGTGAQVGAGIAGAIPIIGSNPTVRGIGAYLGASDEDREQFYAPARDARRDAEAAAREKAPIAALSGDVAGAIPGMVLPGRIPAMVAEGAVRGVGGADSMADAPEDAAVGGAIGGFFGGISRGLGSLFGKRGVANAATKEAAERAAEREAAEAALLRVDSSAGAAANISDDIAGQVRSRDLATKSVDLLEDRLANPPKPGSRARVDAADLDVPTRRSMAKERALAEAPTEVMEPTAALRPTAPPRAQPPSPPRVPDTEVGGFTVPGRPQLPPLDQARAEVGQMALGGEKTLARPSWWPQDVKFPQSLTTDKGDKIVKGRIDDGLRELYGLGEKGGTAAMPDPSIGPLDPTRLRVAPVRGAAPDDVGTAVMRGPSGSPSSPSPSPPLSRSLGEDSRAAVRGWVGTEQARGVASAAPDPRADAIRRRIAQEKDDIGGYDQRVGELRGHLEQARASRQAAEGALRTKPDLSGREVGMARPDRGDAIPADIYARETDAAGRAAKANAAADKTDQALRALQRRGAQASNMAAVGNAVTGNLPAAGAFVAMSTVLTRNPNMLVKIAGVAGPAAEKVTRAAAHGMPAAVAAHQQAMDEDPAYAEAMLRAYQSADDGSPVRGR